MTKQGFSKLKSLSEALEIMDSLVKEKGYEEILVDDSFGRVLASDVVSNIDVPDFEKSAMDGFAVKASETFGASQSVPKLFEIIDSVTAGVFSKEKVFGKKCVEITTGAPLPDGADAVVMVENTEKEGKTVKIYKALAPAENIIKIGSDVRKGTVILKKGTKLSPEKIGVLSAIGLVNVRVKCKPVIAYFSSGNEIQRPGGKHLSGKIYDINSSTIKSAIKSHGCELVDLGLVKDNLSDIQKLIKDGVKSADIVILSGGSSLGG